MSVQVDQSAPLATGAAAHQSQWPDGLKVYVVVLLMVTSILSYVDRQVLPVLLTPIKRDLHISDTQLGLLTGVFFSVFYALAGMPLGRLADTGNRRSLIAVCMAGWSLATCLCGMIRNFLQFAVTRTLVAVGEAGSAPATYSLLADLYPPTRRAQLFSLISCGSAIGIGLGIYLGGALSEHFAWRTVFLIVGAPGLLLAGLIRLTLPEPGRPREAAGAPPRPSVVSAIVGFSAVASYRAMIAIAALACVSFFGALAWLPTFFERVHRMAPGEIGAVMGVATVAGLVFGNVTCGLLADRLARRDLRGLMRVGAAGLLASVPFGLLTVFLPDKHEAELALGLFMAAFGFWSPPVMTVAIGVVPLSARALAASTIPLFQAVGGAIGPLLIGMFNDRTARTLGSQAVRYSTALSLISCLLAGVVAILANGAVRREYRVQAPAGAL